MLQFILKKRFNIDKRQYCLEVPGLECIWVELRLRSKKVLYGTFYIPPNSSAAIWDCLERSIDLAVSCNVDSMILVGDFNDNQLNPRCHKIKDIMQVYSLHQLINEATYFTEHSSSLIDLIITNDPMYITYTEVGPALTDLTRYHCPTYGIINCEKQLLIC